MKKKIMPYITSIIMLLTAFSTIGIHYASAESPPEPSQPVPSHGSSGVTVFIDLRWTCNEEGLTFDVYFGTENPPPLVVEKQSETFFEPDRLLLNTTYYWQIVTFNPQQEFTEGPIWSFTTATNQPPFRPKVLDGVPTAGRNIPLEFTTVAPDPEGDQVYYQWDWGDGNMSEWLGPYDFGEQIKTSYQWENNGTYNITVRAKDIEGRESGWSSTYQVTIASQIELSNCKPGYLYLRFFTFDKTYGYIYSLDLLGMSLIISTGGMTVDATGSDSVHQVIFQMKNRFLIDQQWNSTSENSSGSSFQGFFILNDGLYETMAYAYDGNGRLIDIATRQYVIYYTWKFVLLKQLLGLQ
jgi:hypothetical protein